MDPRGPDSYPYCTGDLFDLLMLCGLGGGDQGLLLLHSRLFCLYLQVLYGHYLAIKWCLQRTWYPVKQCCCYCCEKCDFFYHPYKKKVPYTHVPKFDYGT
mmetsp:Transcript_15921/g.34663  ORF Transcript_15921/g.34663 Transcript_15921/m.34663 type:complete len:100 (+) Transcript_15921:204-503(+)